MIAVTKKYRIPVYGSASHKGISDKHRFILKPDLLFSFLDRYKLTQIHSITYRLGTSRAVVISARYKGELHQDRLKALALQKAWRGDDIGNSEIRVYSVAPEDEKAAREVIIGNALPLMCEWLRDTENQSSNWRRNDHSIVFRFKKGQLSFTLDEEGYW